MATLTKEDQVMFKKEEEMGSPKAKEILAVEEQREDYQNKVIESGKYKTNEDGEKSIDTGEMSPDQIGETCETEIAHNEAIMETCDRFCDEAINDFGADAEEKVDNVINAGQEYNKTLAKKKEEIEEKPERAAEAGKIVTQNADKIDKGYKDLRNSENKEEFEKNADRLTNLYEYGKLILNKHTRDADKKDKIFTDAIEQQEEIIKNLQANIAKKYPEQKQEYENEKRAIEEEKSLLKALIVTAKNDKEKAEYMESMKNCDEYIEKIYPQIMEDIDKKIKQDEEQIEAIAKQIEFFKETRHNIRKERYLPATVIKAGYDKLVEMTPIMINKTEDIKDNLKEIIRLAETKAGSTLKTFKNWMGNKFLDAVKTVSTKLNTWIDKKENNIHSIHSENNKPAFKVFMDKINNSSRKKRRMIRRKFEKIWQNKHNIPIGTWNETKAKAAVAYLDRINGNKRQAQR